MAQRTQRGSDQYGKELVRAAREKYAARLLRQLPPYTRAALRKQREEIRRENAEASAASADAVDLTGYSAGEMSSGEHVRDGYQSWDYKEKDSGSEFEPNEEVGYEEESDERSKSESDEDKEGLPSDVADDPTTKPSTLHQSQPEEVLECQRRLMGEEITTGEDGGFLDGFPRRWSSWNRFHKALLDFCQETYQRFPTRSTSSVKRRNKQIAKNTTVDTQVMPIQWKTYSKTLVCTHGYPYKPRVSGSRRHDLVRYCGCKAKINVKLTWDDKWYLFVQPKGFHNHRCTAALWRYYVENRQIVDPSLLQNVSSMRSSGSNVSGILAYLRKRTNKQTTPRDVHNLIQSLKHSGQNNHSDVDRAKDILREFCAEEEGNCAEFAVDPTTKIAQVVCFQSARMKRIFRAFPQVVMVDTTHGTNRNRYKLFSFVVHDVFGKGQYVQHALVVSETKDNLRCAVEFFKKNNPEWHKIEVFVLDKAFHEKDVLQEEIPQARQLLCHFHVQEWLHLQVARRTTGKKAEKDLLKGTVSALIAAKSAEDYRIQKQALLEQLGGDEKHEFYQFFLLHWVSCKEQWTAYLRGDVPHLRNNTNNCIEAKWGAIKKCIKSSFEIDSAISTLITLQTWAEEAYIGELSRVGSRPVVAGESRELSALAVHISSHAFEYVKGEFDFAESAAASYEVDTCVSGHAALKSTTTHETHVIDLKTYSCTCAFMKTLLLPCRHVMYYRRQNSCESIIPPLSFFQAGGCFVVLRTTSALVMSSLVIWRSKLSSILVRLDSQQ